MRVSLHLRLSKAGLDSLPNLCRASRAGAYGNWWAKLERLSQSVVPSASRAVPAAALKLHAAPLQVLNSYAEQEVAADARIAAVRLRHLSLTHQQQKLEATLKQKGGSCCQCSVAAACAGMPLLPVLSCSCLSGIPLLHLAHLMPSCTSYLVLTRSGFFRGRCLSKACVEASQGMTLMQQHAP